MNAEEQRHRREGGAQSYYLREVERLGGKEQVAATLRAFEDMECAMAKNVASTPDAFGANCQADSQAQAVKSIMQNLSEQYLKNLCSDLRRKAGYVQICGLWLHRSVITFMVYGVMAAIALTFFVPMVLSPRPGAWWHGALGLMVTLAGGIAILTRVRN